MLSPESAESKRLRFSDDERSWAVALMPVAHLQSGWTLFWLRGSTMNSWFSGLGKTILWATTSPVRYFLGRRSLLDRPY